VTLGAAVFAFGATLGEDGSIILPINRASPLFRVPAPGTAAKRITELTKGETTHLWPQILPGGQAVLFTAAANLSNPETSNIEATSSKPARRRL